MRTLLVFTLLLARFVASAQINVGSSGIATANKAGKLSGDDIAELKKTTTYFVLQKKDYDHVADFEKAIASAWKVSKYQVIREDEIGAYAGNGSCSFFSFGGYFTEKQNSAGMNSLFTLHASYDLWIPEISKKGKIRIGKFYSRIMLSLDADAVLRAHEQYGFRFEESMMDYFYNEANFNNWGAGFLKGYLATISDLLVKGETRGKFTSDEDDAALEALKKDTLYIPDYVNTHFSPYTAIEKDNGKNDEDLAEVYSHPLKLIKADQLNTMILTATRPIYYLVYVRSAADKFVTVYKDGHGMVFSRYTPISYNFKNKDLHAIDKVLK